MKYTITLFLKKTCTFMQEVKMDATYFYYYDNFLYKSTYTLPKFVVAFYKTTNKILKC